MRRPYWRRRRRASRTARRTLIRRTRGRATPSPPAPPVPRPRPRHGALRRPLARASSASRSSSPRAGCFARAALSSRSRLCGEEAEEAEEEAAAVVTAPRWRCWRARCGGPRRCAPRRRRCTHAATRAAPCARRGRLPSSRRRRSTLRCATRTSISHGETRASPLEMCISTPTASSRRAHPAPHSSSRRCVSRTSTTCPSPCKRTAAHEEARGRTRRSPSPRGSRAPRHSRRWRAARGVRGSRHLRTPRTHYTPYAHTVRAPWPTHGMGRK